jgi:dTDP-4-amino-4,6-dideoxygalactose transaminase
MKGSQMMQVPFLDLKTQVRQIEAELAPVLAEIMSSCQFIGGPQVNAFEEEFAAFCDSGQCIGVGSGTDALRFALTAAGVGPGDEVITVPHTFIATTEAISQVGATPVFVDIDANTCNMSIDRLQECIDQNYKIDQSTHQPVNRSTKNKLRAIVPVHIYGQPVDMDPILNIAENYNMAVIEDSCQAHGALYKDRKAGSMGVAGCFSFYPGKNLGAFGEAGAVVTQNASIAEKIRMIRDHGQSQKYTHEMEGYNGRLDAIQAAVLRLKLKRLEKWNEFRRKNAALYTHLLSDVPGVKVVEEADFARSVYHLYVIMVDDRDGLQKYLGEKGIGTGLHYPMPLHLQKAYADRGYTKGDFPDTERNASRMLSLPMFAELTHDQIGYVVDSIKEFLEKQ